MCSAPQQFYCLDGSPVIHSWCPLNFTSMFLAWAIVPKHYFQRNNRVDCQGTATVKQPITGEKQHGTAVLELFVLSDCTWQFIWWVSCLTSGSLRPIKSSLWNFRNTWRGKVVFFADLWDFFRACDSKLSIFFKPNKNRNWSAFFMVFQKQKDTKTNHDRNYIIKRKLK